jgi:3-keto-disaccharide hydrolase
MRLKLSLFAVFVLVVPELFAKGWINLFNGKNLSGWTQKSGNAKYFVEDGCIVGQMHVPGGGTNSFLCTTKDYDNFILELDFKADPRVNSGVQIRSQFADKPVSIAWRGRTIKIGAGYVYGYQAEVDTDLKGKTWTGGIYDEHRRGSYIDPDDGINGLHGRAFTELNRQITKPNDWNHLRIEAVGDSIKTYLNGVLRADTRDSMTPKGFIGLQVHNSNEPLSDGAQVRFKNIRLQKVSLKPPVAEPPPNTLTEKEKKAGWRLLWDGQTTDGWRSAKSDEFPDESWVIKDGELWVTNNTGGEAQHGGDIITRERFSNFELSVDFKITPGCNSGIKIFVQPNLSPIDKVTGKPAAVGSAIGLEYQILDDARHPDAKLGRNGDRTLGSLYDLMTASKNKKPNFIGEWNTARIVARGNRVEHWLNGKKILSYTRGSAAFRKAVAESKFKDIPNFGEWPNGYILLQEHGSPVAFRNIKIRVLPD